MSTHIAVIPPVKPFSTHPNASAGWYRDAADRSDTRAAERAARGDHGLAKLDRETAAWHRRKAAKAPVHAPTVCPASPRAATPAPSFVATAGLARIAALQPKPAPAAAPAPVQPTPNSARAAVEGSDAQLWEYFQSADVHDSNILASDPAAYVRIKNESRRRLTR